MIVTRPSHIHGIGCFARQDALQGTNLGPMPRETRGFNHGCEPNVELRPRSIKKRGKRMIDFDPIALRDIKAGEELLVNYYKDDPPGTYSLGCRCPVHQKGTMKTEVQLARTDLELHAIDEARSELRYLGYRPGQDTFKSHLRAFEDKLVEAIRTSEFWAEHPGYKFG